MRLSTLLLLTTAALGVGGVAWSQHCRAQAELQMRVLAARLEPIGHLRYQHLRAWPWGRGSVRDLSLELSSVAAEKLGLVAGDMLRAERVDLLSHRARDKQTTQALSLRWSGLHWPLPATAHPPDAARLQLSQLRELGLSELHIDGELALQYLPSERSLRLRIGARARSLAALDSELSLRGGPELFLGRFESLELSRARFDYRDLGLLAKIRQSPILRGLVDGSSPDGGLAARFERATEARAWRWSAADDLKVQEFLRQPTSLRLLLEPPGRLQLRNLGLYANADLPQVLGVEFSTPPDTAP